MKSMTYKIGPLEKCHHNTPRSQMKPKVSIIEMNDYNTSASDTDSIEKDYTSDSANSREDLTKKQDDVQANSGNINEDVIIKENAVDANNKDNGSDQRSDRLSTSDATSDTNESGFGTVDDESDEKCEDHINEIKTVTQPPVVYQPLQQKGSQQNQAYISDISSGCPTNNSSQQSDNIGKYPQGIKLPSLQGPRQIIYELNKNNIKSSDDIANILHDNSSINSSSSSDDQGSSNCLHSLMNRLNKCYYSCFCCFPTSTGSQTPLCCTWLSIFCCCCPIFGLVSMYLTKRSKKLKLNQKYAKAEKYSNLAEKLNIAALICGVIFYAIAVFMITLVIFMYWRHNNTL